jgi:hypothetical protein
MANFPRSRRAWERAADSLSFAAGGVLILIAVWFRCVDLGRIPGINGDEAWYGVQAVRILDRGCVAARTPTGNPLNPFMIVPQVLLHEFAPPTFALLRTPALVSGLLALLLNFALCHRVFGWPVAWLTTLIHAVLPINIAYSRFAWDASQSLLFTLPVVYAGVLAIREPAQRRRWAGIGGVFLAASTLVHPTNVFLAPFFAVVCGAAWKDRLSALWSSRLARRVVLPLVAVIALVSLRLLWPRAAANLGALENYTAFAVRFGDLFTGETVYEYISGAVIPAGEFTAQAPLTVVLRWLSVSLAGVTAFALWKSIRRGRSALDRWLFAAWAASVAAFFAIAGPAAISPHFERYSICLVAPTVLILGRALHWWTQPTTRFALATRPLVLALAAGTLATFHDSYFDQFNRNGGRSHLTFRTAAVEPKQQAMQIIAQQRRPDLPLLIETSEWWLYWPLAYLAYPHKDIQVELRSAEDPRPLDQQAFADREVWIVVFAESEAGWRLIQMLNRNAVGDDCMVRATFLDDAGRRKLLLLVKLSQAKSPLRPLNDLGKR